MTTLHLAIALSPSPDFLTQHPITRKHVCRLPGKKLKGQNLAGANFSYADIRGTDFTRA
ncbi:pentapeptide repeat-containing protein, partial [Nostoc sp.]